jgi:hypothetical protein
MMTASSKSSGKSIKTIVTEVLKTVFGADTTVGYSQGCFRITLKDVDVVRATFHGSDLNAVKLVDRVVEVLIAADIRGYSGEKLGHQVNSFSVLKDGTLVVFVETIFPE